MKCLMPVCSRPAQLYVTADPPDVPPVTSPHVERTERSVALYVCALCLFDATQALREEGYVNIRVSLHTVPTIANAKVAP